MLEPSVSQFFIVSLFDRPLTNFFCFFCCRLLLIKIIFRFGRRSRVSRGRSVVSRAFHSKYFNKGQWDEARSNAASMLRCRGK